MTLREWETKHGLDSEPGYANSAKRYLRIEPTDPRRSELDGLVDFEVYRVYPTCVWLKPRETP